MRETFHVRKSYFKNKCRGMGSSCPVARAILANGYTNVFVADGAAFETFDGRKFWFDLPKRVRAFIGRFDNKSIPLNTFKPFSFTLNV